MRLNTYWQQSKQIFILGLVLTSGGLASEAKAQPFLSKAISARLDLGWRPASRTFAGTRVFPLWEEQASFHSQYEISGGGVIDGGLSFSMWRNLALGVDIASYRSINQANITSEMPHPIFFDLPRSTSGAAGGLERQELGVHLRVAWMTDLTDWLSLSLSTGPSLINARQDLVATVQHSEIAFPFDKLKFDGHTVTTQSETTLGWNAAVDVNLFVLKSLPYRALQRVGFGFLLRYVRGSVDLLVSDTPIEVDLGGLQMTTGLRFRF